jgi:hypothetical protein
VLVLALALVPEPEPEPEQVPGRVGLSAGSAALYCRC